MRLIVALFLFCTFFSPIPQATAGGLLQQTVTASLKQQTDTQNMAPKVVLLTSVHFDPHTPQFVRRRVIRNVEKRFKQFFENNFKKQNTPIDFAVRHNVGALELHQTLMDPTYTAIYFISHAYSEDSSADKQTPGLSATNVITTYDGYNVAEVFKTVNPNLKYLAVIGCYTQNILLKYQSQGHFAGNPNLALRGFDKKIKLTGKKSGLAQTLQESLPLLTTTATDNPIQPIVDVTPTHNVNPTLLLARQVPADTTSQDIVEVQVYWRGRLVGVFPKAQPGQTQKMIVSLTNFANTTGTKRFLSLKTGDIDFEKPPAIGIITGFDSESGLTWSIRMGLNNKPIGVDEQILIPQQN